MATQSNYAWRRDKDGLGVWEHRGKVAVAGVGHSPVDRRWNGVSMDKTLGAYTILACQKAMDEAGVTPDQIDGIICCDSHIAGGSGGSASRRAPRAPFPPPPYSVGGAALEAAVALAPRPAIWMDAPGGGGNAPMNMVAVPANGQRPGAITAATI